MNDPAHQMLWRESLRKSKDSKALKAKTCKKLERHSVRETIITALEQKLSPMKTSPRKSIKKKTAERDSLKANCSKLENFHKEILYHYQDVIKKQQKDLNQVMFENQVLEQKIEKLKRVNCSDICVELDAEEKIVDYYKSSIRLAENMIIGMKKEFSSKISNLIQEKSQLEAEIAFKGIEYN